MVQYVNLTFEPSLTIVLNDEDYIKLQTLDDPNIYKFLVRPFLRIKVDGKYKSFEVFIFGLEKFCHFRHIDEDTCNYRRDNLIMVNEKQCKFISWDQNRKKWRNTLFDSNLFISP